MFYNCYIGVIQLQIKAIVVGYDKHFSFAKLIKACSYAKNPCNHFIGTNEDTFLPIENKEIVVPGKLVKYSGKLITFSI